MDPGKSQSDKTLFKSNTHHSPEPTIRALGNKRVLDSRARRTKLDDHSHPDANSTLGVFLRLPSSTGRSTRQDDSKRSLQKTLACDRLW